MSILDIGKAMAIYNQPTEFDQNAWKTAFDIANAFNTASNNYVTLENNRITRGVNALKHQENMATSDNRVAWQNWDYNNRMKTGDFAQVKSHYEFDKLKATDEDSKALDNFIAENIGKNPTEMQQAIMNSTLSDNQKAQAWGRYQALNEINTQRHQAEQADFAQRHQAIIDNSYDTNYDPITGQTTRGAFNEAKYRQNLAMWEMHNPNAKAYIQQVLPIFAKNQGLASSQYDLSQLSPEQVMALPAALNKFLTPQQQLYNVYGTLDKTMKTAFPAINSNTSTIPVTPATTPVVPVNAKSGYIPTPYATGIGGGTPYGYVQGQKQGTPLTWDLIFPTVTARPAGIIPR
ncbi:hypothetical protein [Caviibacterium pharyngocola]|uniref:Uncharacterized protein n=1 Tax=Caviibacterium pharyngocola TaxID=28159 RepID=A0A2M8RY00_9PAST|nr:hypothetical protein [Caviibacterium pharyngocola]PJG83756.1 hypothetical protein CVP04_02540 [Caviibacterium pharyngocola]